MDYLPELFVAIGLPLIYTIVALIFDKYVSIRKKTITIGKREVTVDKDPQTTLSNIRKLVDEINRNPVVFIAHSFSDISFVQQLSSDLSAFGVEVWTAFSEISFGQNIYERIEEAIASSQWFLIVLSSNSSSSEHILREFRSASGIERDKGRTFIIPLLLSDTEIPENLKNKKYVDYRFGYIKPTVDLLHTILSSRVDPDQAQELLQKKYELLTPRQHAMLRFVAAHPNATTEDIAKEFKIAPSTVRNWMSKTYKRLRVTSRKGAIQKAAKLGFINLD